MEQTRQNPNGGRQLPMRHGLISELRAQGAAKDLRERQPEEQRQQTVGAVKIWSVVE